MPGLLNRAKDIRLPEDAKPETLKHVPSLEIEEFEDSSFLKISDDIYERVPNRFSEKSFLSSINKIEDGIELPARFFESARNHLQFSDGALLLWDKEEKSYAPWTTSGLDKTTAHRLRFSTEDIENLQSGLSHPLFYKKNEMEPFRRYFSIRLFDQLESLTFSFFFSGESTLGILLIINSETNFDNDLNHALEIVSREGAVRLGSSRFLNLSVEQPSDEISLDEIYDKIDKIIEAVLAQNKKLSLIFLNLERILVFLVDKNSHMDDYRIKKDILTILNSMVGGIGEVINVDKFRTILLLTSKSPIRDQALIHQIQLSVQSFFQHKEGFPDIDAEIRRIPDDGMESWALLEKLV